MAEPQSAAEMQKLLKQIRQPHRAPPIYRFFATGLGATMWFFLMYRAKKDGAVLLGWKHPWDH